MHFGPRHGFRIGPEGEIVAVCACGSDRVARERREAALLPQECGEEEWPEQETAGPATHCAQCGLYVALTLPEAGQNQVCILDPFAAADFEDECARERVRDGNGCAGTRLAPDHRHLGIEQGGAQFRVMREPGRIRQRELG